MENKRGQGGGDMGPVGSTVAVNLNQEGLALQEACMGVVTESSRMTGLSLPMRVAAMTSGGGHWGGFLEMVEELNSGKVAQFLQGEESQVWPAQVCPHQVDR